MIVAIQQPEHLPWLGFFDKMLRCDVYIFLDNVQFKKRYFESRNRIRTRQGWQWITVPVVTKGRYTQKINDVMIDNSTNWQRKYIGSLQTSYSKTPYFKEFFPALEEILLKNQRYLAALNLELIKLQKEYFKINTPCFRASDLVKPEFTGSDLLLELCLKLGADTYISGPDGENYLNLDRFKQHGIEIVYHNYEHPIYSQLHGTDFISHMSAVDYVFNHSCWPV